MQMCIADEEINMLGVCLRYSQHNYGSKLQALATVKMFEELKIEYKIIRYNKKEFSFYIKSLPRMFNITFLIDRFYGVQRKIGFSTHPSVKKQIKVRNRCFDEFDVFFKNHLSEKYESYNVLKSRCSNDFDQVITCSDQLWSPAALGSGFYNLAFAGDDINKVSWASSFGVSSIPWYQKKRTKDYLEKINYISMRENRGAEIVEELTGKKVPVLMDPVFVFNRKQWEVLIPINEPEWENYIFCYFLGSNSECRKAASELAQKTGCKIVTIRHLDEFVKSDESFGDIALYDVSPERFLNIIRNAKYVLTDSFHGCAFSIINEKQFIVFNRYSDASVNSKNSRIDTVCANTGLDERRYNREMPISEQIDHPINYEKVKTILDEYASNTRLYLKKALKVK